MKKIKTYKGVDLFYNENNAKICFEFEEKEREVKYVFEAQEIIDEPVWKQLACVEGYFIDGYIDKFIGLARAYRQNIKNGGYDWKIKGQYDMEFKRPNFNENPKVYLRTAKTDKIYKEWKEQREIYLKELRRLNDIADSLKI